MRLGAYAIHVLLHLAVTAIAAFHGVGSGRKEFVVQEREGFLQIGRKQFLQRMALPVAA